jgi:small-conductance mechanosensitive channel/CRP-like cAMP-binding protein
MSTLSAILVEAAEDATAWVAAASVVASLLVPRRDVEDRRRIKSLFALLLVHLLLVVMAGTFAARGSAAADELRLAARVAATLVAVAAAGAIVFRAILPRLNVRAPRILQDVAIAGAAIIALLVVASRSGLEVTGVVATSAVITAVIALSLQDTLGNVVGGLALQTDESVQVDDWVKVGDVSGRIVDIRWRYTAIETRNGETVLVPNGVLIKSQVMILGRRQGKPRQWRRWVFFHVDYRHPPPDVVAAVEGALRGCDIPAVAKDPPPNCVLMDLGESWARYAVRYWLTDLQIDDPTDSLVRQRVFFALQRAGMRLALSKRALYVTKQDDAQKEAQVREETTRRESALASVPLFAALSPEDRAELASSMSWAPFVEGEVLTRQGAKAHWLYVVVAGECSVRVAVDGAEREVGRIRAGEFFGEMGLLTGAPRAATVVAASRVDCWRLDRAAFQALLERRPELAEVVAAVLAERQLELDGAREELGQEGGARRQQANERRIADAIRSFFGLGDDRVSRM